MPVHPDIVSRFHLLDGLTSLREAYGSAEGRAQIDRFDTWETDVPPPAVETRDTTAPGPHGPVPVRVYGPAPDPGVDRPCLVWVHGGAFVGGDLDMQEADGTSRGVSSRADAVVVSVDYRLAGDGVSYPIPHDDVVAVLTWVRAEAAALGVDPARIWLGGASAGANLSAGAALRVRDRDGWVPAGLLLVYGLFHAALPVPSRQLAARMAELPALFHEKPGEDPSWLNLAYLGGSLSTADGYAMPALAVLDGLCPTLLVNAEYDHLRASAEAFAATLALAGVDVRQVLVPGAMHGFLSLPAQFGPTGRCLDLLAEVVAASPSTAPTTPR